MENSVKEVSLHLGREAVPCSAWNRYGDRSRDLQVGALKRGQGRVQDKKIPRYLGRQTRLSAAFYTKAAVCDSYMSLE